MRTRRSFTKAFKAEAVRLLEQSGKPAAELARELGIPRNRLYKWQAQVRAHGRIGVRVQFFGIPEFRGHHT